MFKNIYTDVDGVILNWSDPYRKWLSECHGINLPEVLDEYSKAMVEDLKFGNMVKRFNQTMFSHNLPEFGNSKAVLQGLKYMYNLNIICVTAYCGDQVRRWDNLVDVFGEGLFTDVVFTDDKEKYLKTQPKDDSIFVEDKFSNYLIGEKLGMTAFLMKQPWNEQHMGKAYIVDNWDNIQDYINDKM